MSLEGKQSAFPWVANDSGRGRPFDQEYGITVRDYFAAQALIGFMRSATPYNGDWSLNAINAYKQADAMLEARSK